MAVPTQRFLGLSLKDISLGSKFPGGAEKILGSSENRKEGKYMNQYEMKKLAYQSNLRNRALQVLLYLIDRANKEQTCFPAVRTIARELHISVSTVKRAMQELVESGYVTKESRFRESNGGQTSNLYTLYFPKKVGEEWKEEEQEKSEPVSMKQFECKKAYCEETTKKSQMKQSDYEEVRGTGTESGAEEGKKRCVEDRINVSEMKMVYSGKKFRNESADFFRWTGEEISLIPP